MRRPSIIDLFCGCGGFGLGAELAGFHTLAAIDVDRDLQSSYRLNFPSTRVIEGDIGQLDQSCWNDILGRTRPDGIIGGPPCQGFSVIGKRDKNDKRNQLVGHFFRQINILSPKFFVMENVEGIMGDYGQEIVNEAISTLILPYQILGPTIVDAKDFGAATRRRRAVIVGFLPEEVDGLTESKLFSSRGIRKATVRDAIYDLPSPVEQKNRANDFGLNDYSKNVRTRSYYAVAAMKRPRKELGWRTEKDWFEQGKLSGFHDTNHTAKVRDRFQSVEPGSSDKISKYPKLNWDSVSPTLRAGTGSDRGSFQAVRPIHPEEPRVITVREAARLQGFPDWFVFHPTKWHSFRMIGNSVSPYVSAKILKRIRTSLV